MNAFDTWDMTNTAADEQKKRSVLNYLSSNNHATPRSLVEKFGLDWDLVKERDNGIAEIELIAGNVQVLTFNDDVKKWFR